MLLPLKSKSTQCSRSGNAWPASQILLWREEVIAAPFCGLSGSGSKLLKPPPRVLTHGATQFLCIVELKSREREQKRELVEKLQQNEDIYSKKVLAFYPCRVTIANGWLRTGYHGKREKCSKMKFRILRLSVYTHNHFSRWSVQLLVNADI